MYWGNYFMTVLKHRNTDMGKHPSKVANIPSVYLFDDEMGKPSPYRSQSGKPRQQPVWYPATRTKISAVQNFEPSGYIFLAHIRRSSEGQIWASIHDGSVAWIPRRM
ncbi:hypothetical protein QBC42DRAFT_9821 [Cladorrhinum samala]|uniref:Uncharacterized protein n=1 Tax=Cladorrhinum samala TaxID=585594 RepID=A0AAV9HIC7_9PEZI|nr:hypothetical protein QBC42DRAFT_9821 [Cladorrhinum samala]